MSMVSNTECIFVDINQKEESKMTNCNGVHENIGFCVKTHKSGHYCGYVCVPEDHIACTWNYDLINSMDLDVHGEIDFIGPLDDREGHWLGWAYNHSLDMDRNIHINEVIMDCKVLCKRLSELTNKSDLCFSRDNEFIDLSIAEEVIDLISESIHNSSGISKRMEARIRESINTVILDSGFKMKKEPISSNCVFCGDTIYRDEDPFSGDEYHWRHGNGKMQCVCCATPTRKEVK